VGAIDDILDWSSTKLSPWKQDALRRLACQSALTKADHDELLDHIKDSVGFATTPKPAALVPLDKAHFGSSVTGASLHIKTIRNVENVNRLVPAASLTFVPQGLTVVYGRNGSGKSGFVRIFRTACRTRVERPEKLKVLADVYGSGHGPQKAEIVIEHAGVEEVVTWISGGSAHEALLHVAVFDSSAAQLYVDGGSNIQFLPFGLALPHKLNELCLELKDRLENERKPIMAQLGAAIVNFAVQRQTAAQVFYGKLTTTSIDEQIDKASAFSKEDQERLDLLTRLLTGASTAAADLTALATWIGNVSGECAVRAEALSDAKLAEGRSAKAAAAEARKLAGLDSSKLFKDEPLPGIGSESWRQLWQAARDFSVVEAYAGQPFPFVSTEETEAACVLCLQPLGTEASSRLERFEVFVSGKIATAADEAEARVKVLLEAIPAAGSFAAADWDARLEQITKRDKAAGDALVAFKTGVETSRDLLRALLEGEPEAGPMSAALASPADALKTLAEAVAKEAKDATAAHDETVRAKMMDERAELEDRKILSLNVSTLKKRHDLLKQDGFYVDSMAEVATAPITKRANELVDVHLTKVVLDQYESERKALEIAHLKVGLTRKSGKLNASFQTNPGTAMTKFASEILSEGEQRALALAAFFTEVAVTDGSGPIVIDDPVSSLDRQRGLKVAARIAAEAKKRQVIVFTHDLIFFNELCREAGTAGVANDTIALFADGSNAGKIDPAGVLWKGLSVDRRLKLIKNDAVAVKKLHGTSPAAYEYQMKGLYGRLRDTYERAVEEIIFYDIVQRFSERIETMKLRYVHLSDTLAVRFHDGMTKANTHSHDNPAAETVQTPEPSEFDADIAAFEKLIADLKAEQKATEANRPSMKPK
jgi:energy-coupling factor transporter ATP-binding protein EcfA2